MKKEYSSFKHNACRIDLKVAGQESKASGFIYRTKPSCDYDYVLTVKHAFQEGTEIPQIKKITNIKISYEHDFQKTIELYDSKNIESSLLFIYALDMTIIRIKKQYISGIRRIAVKNANDTSDNCPLTAHAFIDIRREESTKLECEWKDRERGIIKIFDIDNIAHYRGASGSGIYCSNKPFLIGILNAYRLPYFEQNEIQITIPNWENINIELRKRKWSKFNLGKAHFTTITDDLEVIDLRELSINKATLNFEVALKNLKHDLIDDWYFDPLHYTDICNTDFVLNFFSKGEVRHKYKSQKMEVFYLPKKTFVMRKAMVGTFIDRLVYMAVVSQLSELIDSHLSCYVYSARCNLNNAKSGLIVPGVEQWTKMNYLLNTWVRETKDGCLVKLDLLNYYDTINKTTLARLLNEIAISENDKACVKLLKQLLDGFSNKESNQGIPQNSDASSLLATFYLSHIDEFILSRAVQYCRFMDDMYFVSKDRYEARELLQSIERHLRQISLSLNGQKIRFVKLNNDDEKKEFLNELSLFDLEKSQIQYLIRSSLKGKRMNAVALLINQIKIAFDHPQTENNHKIDNGLKISKSYEMHNKDRALKFATSAFSYLKIKLDSEWDDFYKVLIILTKEQIDAPENTPLICRLIASINSKRDITNIKEAIKIILLRKEVTIYEWQAYHLWMLMAYLQFEDKELIQFAMNEIETNNETRREEIAAIIIYLVTINNEYARIILHKLRNGLFHGNLQYRCALIALRSLGHQVIDEEVKKAINNEALCLSHEYLTKHKDKSLIFFQQNSSSILENNAPFYTEFYSGL